MKNTLSKTVKYSLLLLFAAIFFTLTTSCRKEVELSDLTGHWVISNRSMTPLMTMDFYCNRLVDINNSTLAETPHFGSDDIECATYRTYLERYDTILLITVRDVDYYVDDDDFDVYNNSTSYKFHYHRTGNNTLELVSDNNLFLSQQIYSFIRR